MSDLEDILARCAANVAKLREDIAERARIERTRWKPQPEPRVARSQAKIAAPDKPGWATRPEAEEEWRR